MSINFICNYVLFFQNTSEVSDASNTQPDKEVRYTLIFILDKAKIVFLKDS